MGKKTSVEDLLKADGKLKELRKRRNLIQEQLADEIGTSQQTVSRVEKDKLSMSIETLIRLTVYFNVSADYMLEFPIWFSRKTPLKSMNWSSFTEALMNVIRNWYTVR